MKKEPVLTKRERELLEECFLEIHKEKHAKQIAMLEETNSPFLCKKIHNKSSVRDTRKTDTLNAHSFCEIKDIVSKKKTNEAFELIEKIFYKTPNAYLPTGYDLKIIGNTIAIIKNGVAVMVNSGNNLDDAKDFFVTQVLVRGIYSFAKDVDYEAKNT